MSKNKEVKKVEEVKVDKKIIGRMVKDAKPIYGALAFGTFMSMLSVACGLVTPLLMGQIVDKIDGYLKLVATNPTAVLDLVGIGKDSIMLAIFYVLSSALAAGKMYLLNHSVSRYYTSLLRKKMSQKIIRMPVSFIDTTPSGEIISRMMNDVSTMGNTVHNFIDLIIVGVLQLVAIAVIMALINWSMALVVIATVPISLVISVLLANRSEALFDKQQEEGGNLYAVIEEDYTNFATIKCYNMEETQREKHRKINDKIQQASMRGSQLSEVVMPVITFTSNISFVLICIIGGYLALKDGISLGDIIAVIVFSKQLGGPLGSIANALSMLQRTSASAKRVYDMLDYEEMPKCDDVRQLNGEGAVTFENVDFSYTDKPLIKDLCLQLNSRQKIAIVGPTGAGKTTIVNLLMRFYEVNAGKIYVDGVDIATLSRENVRKAFSMVLQDTWISNGTIVDNIRYSDPDATREEVEEACRLAYCDTFINALPNGFDTILTNDMTSISAGQKQLLTLARAFLHDSKILILDEATSNIDTRTELLVQKAMDKLMADKTCFVIAHRLSTIVDADLILVLDNGTVVEQGTHRELMAKDGFYAQIYNSQYSLIKQA